jgi:sporulation protein YlmC with PRC-barrel domain
MDSMKHRRLQELDRSDFEVVKGEPDIRGWDVKNSTGQKIGEVEELIVDAQQKKVRYMVVDMDDNELKLDHHKVLIPIGLAELDKKDDDVVLPNVQTDHLRSLPDYDKNHLTPDVERRICNTLGRNTETMTSSNIEEHHPDFYKHDYFNDDNLYKHRLHEAQPVKKESEYDHGLRLWERRSEGGVIPDRSASREEYREREIEENARMEMVRNRRNAYEQRRGGGIGRDNYRDRDNTIEGRIRDEGLQDA